MVNSKIIMLVGDGLSSKIMYHQLSKEYIIEKVFVEKSVSRRKLIKRRLKRLGFKTLFGQLLFLGILSPIIDIFSQKRIEQIITNFNLNISDIPKEKIININSVNDSITIQLIKEISPKVIIVNGTRIISKKVIQSTSAVLLNTHVGITPKYRGVHGGYWALANNDREHCGVTVHLIDEGIDTGEILYHGLIEPTKKDTYATYPLMQTAIGANLMKNAVKDALTNNLKPFNMDTVSNLWYHPTAWTYLINLFFKGIK